MFGFAGFAQFSGEWDTNIHVLQTPSLDYTQLTINYEWSGWTFSSVSKFTRKLGKARKSKHTCNC